MRRAMRRSTYVAAEVLAGGRGARAGTATELAADRSVLAEDYLGPGPRTAP